MTEFKLPLAVKALEMVLEENKALKAENAELRDALRIAIAASIPDDLERHGVGNSNASFPLSTVSDAELKLRIEHLKGPTP